MITAIHSTKSYLLNLLILVIGFGVVAIPSYLSNMLSAETLTAAGIAALIGQVTGSFRIDLIAPQRSSKNPLASSDQGSIYGSDTTDNGNTSTVYVGNLVYRTSREDLIELFRPFGDVISARIILDRETRKSKGYGFVELHPQSAQRAIENLDGLEIQGRTLRVTEAKNR